MEKTTNPTGKTAGSKKERSGGLMLQELSKTYGARSVVDRVTLAVEAGSLHAILGPSGSGKSTLLRMVAGIESTSGGTIRLFGEDITRKAARDRGITMVFQHYSLFPNYSVQENIGYGLRVKKLPSLKAAQKIEELLHLVRMEHLAKARPDELSGGEMQRVAIARALAVDPALLLMDEPLSNLDAHLRGALREQIRRIQRETNVTVLLVTHDQEEALEIADAISVMNEGKILQTGAPATVYQHPSNRFVASFIGSHNVLAAQEAQRLGCPIPEGQSLVLPPEDFKIGVPDTLSGRITRAAFLGSVYRLSVEVQGVSLEILVPAAKSLPAPRVNERLFFALPDDPLVVPHEPQ